MPDFPLERLPFGAWIQDNVNPKAVALSSRDVGVIERAVYAGLGLGFLSDAEARKHDDLRMILPATADWTVTGWLTLDESALSESDRKAIEHPLVQEAKDLFGARVVRVERVEEGDGV